MVPRESRQTTSAFPLEKSPSPFLLWSSQTLMCRHMTAARQLHNSEGSERASGPNYNLLQSEEV